MNENFVYEAARGEELIYDDNGDDGDEGDDDDGGAGG